MFSNIFPPNKSVKDKNNAVPVIIPQSFNVKFLAFLTIFFVFPNMNKINRTKTEDKIKICNEYLIPEIYDTFAFSKEEIIFSDDILKNIIEKYTEGEEGVRNLKRCIETIVSKINIHILSDGDSGLSFQLKDISLPVKLTSEHIEILLKTDNKDDKPPYGMYL